MHDKLRNTNEGSLSHRLTVVQVDQRLLQCARPAVVYIYAIRARCMRAVKAATSEKVLQWQEKVMRMTQK